MGFASVRHLEASSSADLMKRPAFWRAYLISRFTSYVAWPKERTPKSGDKYVFGIIGDEEVAKYLSLLAAKGQLKVKGASVEVKSIQVAEASQVHLLFVANSALDEIAPLLVSPEMSGVLTIGDDEEFIRKGGAMCFREDPKRKIRTMKYSGANLRRTKVKVSPRYLKFFDK